MQQSKPYSLSPKVRIADAQGRYLVIQRSSESTYWPSQWDLPGGKQDPGATFVQTLVRGAKEETGLQINLTGLVGVSEFELPNVRVVFLIMRAKVVGAQFKLSEEHEAHRWVSLTDLKQMDLCGPIAEAIGPYLSNIGA